MVFNEIMHDRKRGGTRQQPLEHCQTSVSLPEGGHDEDDTTGVDGDNHKAWYQPIQHLAVGIAAAHIQPRETPVNHHKPYARLS